jgi:hypothetical protein
MKRFSLLLLLLLLAGCSQGRDAGGPIIKPGSPVSVFRPLSPVPRLTGRQLCDRAIAHG